MIPSKHSLSTSPLTIAVVGDVHEQWEWFDNQALEALAVDLVLFVGDFGNEALPIVEKIASLSIPKAVILGNHDAWYTASRQGQEHAPYDRSVEDRVQIQLDCLGATQVGYGKLDLPQFELSVVGSRPFSWGGPDWKNKRFLRDRYGVNNFGESTRKILAEVTATRYQTVILLGHNGPTGLGEEAEAICGRDWQPLGGDFGDPDFEAAIAASRHQGKQIPLVTFGHMHHNLRHTQKRLRTRVVKDTQGTVYLNAACVPRIIEYQGDRLRNFSLVTLQGGQVTEIFLIWINQNFQIISKESLHTAYATMGNR